MADIQELERQKNEFEASLKKVLLLGDKANLSPKDIEVLQKSPEFMDRLIKVALEYRQELTNVKEQLNTYKNKL